MQNGPIPPEELAKLDADLAARQMIGDMARGLGAYARRPMTEHEHRLMWERATRRE